MRFTSSISIFIKTIRASPSASRILKLKMNVLNGFVSCEVRGVAEGVYIAELDGVEVPAGGGIKCETKALGVHADNLFREGFITQFDLDGFPVRLIEAVPLIGAVNRPFTLGLQYPPVREALAGQPWRSRPIPEPVPSDPDFRMERELLLSWLAGIPRVSTIFLLCF